MITSPQQFVKLLVELKRSLSRTKPTLKKLHEIRHGIRQAAAKTTTVRRCNGRLSDSV
ncbi:MULTISPECIES: hypothetical protein [Trichocoleus]|uniref:Uncharacterized protein n=1 Tax=Trichocoleus desertorum GB2-A4 TaxID=2933944 RepID=A0ABV0J1R3_9CYAN|nr:MULTISPECIES: hypothetical protein [unclassified Trichocoleus]MBD1860331.1 hypothetical protein [Trichocoleus sp. FACHB-46]MBD2097886.1 hypothetical protein [Trichocoleus sp. FACHB-591]